MPDKLTDEKCKELLEYKAKVNCEMCDLKGSCITCTYNLIKQFLEIFNRLQAENERLKPFEDKIAEFKSHIRVEDMLVFASSLEEWLEFCDNLKAEAYKECIEKVKETALVIKENAFQGCYVISKGNLDNILKELVGDK